MNIYPAIDILDGKAVRLLKGDYNKVTVYGEPIEMAALWREQGGDFMHIVDLNGARGDAARNVKAIQKIVQTYDMDVQVGGGIRTMSDIAVYLDSGINRVILGSVCFQNPKVVEDAVIRYGANRIVCGVDAKQDRVAIHGWIDETEKRPVDLCLQMKEIGVRTIIYTDISRDGTLSGVNVAATKKLTEDTHMNIIASGGVASLEDIALLQSNHIYGAILGKALYEKKFTLMEALEIARSGNGKY